MKLLNCIDMLWTLLLLQEMDAAVIAGDGRCCYCRRWTLLLLQVMHGRELCHFVAMAPTSLRAIWLG
jgi:predicted DCC family thiol-disulfide oxidoreductase YuxK